MSGKLSGQTRLIEKVVDGKRIAVTKFFYDEKGRRIRISHGSAGDLASKTLGAPSGGNAQEEQTLVEYTARSGEKVRYQFNSTTKTLTIH